MNSLQLNMVLPQQAQNLNPVQTQKTGGESFAEALKAAQRNDDYSEKSVQKSSGAKSEKLEQNPAVKESEEKSAEEKTSDETKISKKSENSEKTGKTEEKSSPKDKVTKKSDDSDEKKESEKLELAENIENQAAFAKNQIQDEPKSVSRNQKSLKNEKLEEVKNASRNEEINEKSLAWLKSEKVGGQDQTEEISDDFAELIDAAVEFIPGSESEAEKLENAQNYAISDPESFLAQVHELADAEIAQSKQKNQAGILDGKNEKAEESKSKKNRLSFDVHDLRTSKVQNAENADEKAVQKTAAKKEFEASVAQKSDSASQLTMELSGKASADITSSSSQAAGASGSTFQSMLSASVQENAGEIVKAGNIVLKDNNQGSINLILKPEALGNVKISLNLNDKVISGQISVQSREAFEAFRENLDSLKQAFAESGFDTGNFDLNFSQQSFAQGGNSGSENPSASYFAEKTYGDFVALGDVKSSSEEAVFDSSGKDYSVNIVA